MTIIDTDDGEYVLVVAARVCGEGHMHSEVYSPVNMTADQQFQVMSKLADEILRRDSDGQVRLEVVTPAQFRAKVEEAARLKGSYSNVLPFGAPARGPARRWG